MSALFFLIGLAMVAWGVADTLLTALAAPETPLDLERVLAFVTLPAMTFAAIGVVVMALAVAIGQIRSLRQALMQLPVAGAPVVPFVAPPRGAGAGWLILLLLVLAAGAVYFITMRSATPTEAAIREAGYPCDRVTSEAAYADPRPNTTTVIASCGQFDYRVTLAPEIEVSPWPR